MYQAGDNNNGNYWDEVYLTAKASSPINIWRAYMQQIYLKLIRNWLSDFTTTPCLKTDLYEEAVTPYNLLSLFPTGSLGLDCSSEIVVAAQQRLNPAQTGRDIFVADLRSIPMVDGAIKHIFSGSSLDHFTNKQDIIISLQELTRVLAINGTMIITLDNPHNPVIKLRNFLPYKLVNYFGLVPYYVGATLTIQELKYHLSKIGLQIDEITVIAHIPRAPAIYLVKLLEYLKIDFVETLIKNLFLSFEILGRFPSRYLTGYYLAVKLRKAQLSLQN